MSASPTQPVTVPERFLGLDVLRLLSFYAILIFHITFVHYFTPSIAIARESKFFHLLEVYARTLAFSGFTIVLLTSILTSYSGKGLAKRARLFTFLIAGWAVFSSFMVDEGNYVLIWDVYPLLFIGILVATLLEMAAPWLSMAAGLIGMGMLFVPFWSLSPPFQLSRDAAAVLGFGDCMTRGIEWPVFPWVGLVWSGYGIGQGLRMLRKSDRFDRLRLTWPEATLWVSGLALGVPRLGAFYQVRLGVYFACDAYRQPPLTWWAHLLWVFFAIRLAVEPRVAAWLGRRRLFVAIGELNISRRFWVAYFTAYVWAIAVSAFGTATHWELTSWRVELTIYVGIIYFLSIEHLTTFEIYCARRLVERVMRWEWRFNRPKFLTPRRSD